MALRALAIVIAAALTGCGTTTSLAPTEELVTRAQRSFELAEKQEAVRYATDEFLAAKSAMESARNAWRESQQASDVSFKRRRDQNAREDAYKAWHQSEIASANARSARAEAEIGQLRSEILRLTSETERYRAEEKAAQDRRATELARAGRADALAQARAEEEAKQRALREKAEAELRASMESAEKERALQGKRELEEEKRRLESKLTDAMKEIAKVREEKRGLIISLSDILFDFGKATLLPGTQGKLAQLSKILSAYPERQIVVEGHTDNVGSDEFNMQLSEARAESVRAALLEQGLDPAMITARGFGKTQPVASNATAEGRQQNRRVEIVVLNPEPATDTGGGETAP